MSSPHGKLDVPITWLRAEVAAQDLIAAGDWRIVPATFQFRATHDVLALTLFLSGAVMRLDDPPAAHAELVRERLRLGFGWMSWCESGLGGDGTLAETADLRLARGAWNWLQRSRILDAPALPGVGCPDLVFPTGAGCYVGVHHAWRVIARLPAGEP